MTTGIAQPDMLPEHKFRLDDVLCFETGSVVPDVGPSVVVVAGNSVTLRADLGFDGFMDLAYIGASYQVTHHWQRLEDGAVGMLTPAPVAVVPGGPNLAHFVHLTSHYTTGPAGSGADLEMAPGFAAGTFRIMTNIHFLPPNHSTVAAFHDGLILMVISPAP